MTVIDLTQPLGPATRPWPGSPRLATEIAGDLERDGWYSRDIRMPEHIGTHVDAPAHFAAGGATIEGIPAERLVCDAVVLDVVTEDPGFVISADHLAAHEREHGAIPEGALVLAHTGWDRHVGTGAYLGDPLAFPGYGADAAAVLIERGVVGIGIDTLGVDPGASADLAVHHLTLPAGLFHIEGLVGLEQLPPRGATVIVGVPPLEGGSGMTARVLALV